MTKMLKILFERLSALPEDEQEATVTRFLAELEDDRTWDELFSRSGLFFEELAADVAAEQARGETQDLDEFLKPFK